MLVADYISVILSIILGLGLMQTLSGLGGMARVYQHIRPYWLYFIWVMLTFDLLLQFWWAFWDYKQYTAWSFSDFIYVLGGPVSLVFASRVLVPDWDWHKHNVLYAHFFRIRKPFFLSMSAAIFFAMTAPTIIRDAEFFTPYRGIQAIALSLTLLGVFVKAKRGQEIIGVAWYCLWLFAVIMFRSQVGQNL